MARIALLSTLLLYGAASQSNTTLWTSLVRDCKRPTLTCVHDSMYTYLGQTLAHADDVQVGNLLKFQKNQRVFEKTTESRQFQAQSALFFLTHDMEVQLPTFIFGKSNLRIEPRALEGEGTVVKVEVVPRKDDIQEGRFFKKIIEKIKTFVTEKIAWIVMAVLLVVKLIAIKILFIVPTLIGAVAAKKLFLKVVLFFFPSLNHIFKLCPYVPHGMKVHHHNHQISHIHHINGHHSHDDPSPHEVAATHEMIGPYAAGPPKFGGASLHHYSKIDPPHRPSYNPHEQELEYFSGGPALSHSFINSRKDVVDTREDVFTPNHNPFNSPLSPNQIETIVMKKEKEAKLKQRLQQERLKIQEENQRLQEQLKEAIKLRDRLKQQIHVTTPSTPSTFLEAPGKVTVLEKAQPYQKPIIYQKSVQEVSIPYDPFYGPILEKIDKIFNEMGYLEEACRERVVCSMYKNPKRFSPNSNLLSAELSRDPRELQKPATSNAAVIRFYHYVQAARDGQDQKDCLKLYPKCAVNTEQ